jgi:hypothetical protein
MFDRERAFREALGTAVAHVWAELPEPLQEKLFGQRSHGWRPLGAGRETARRAGTHLRDHHPPTAHTDKQ